MKNELMLINRIWIIAAAMVAVCNIFVAPARGDYDDLGLGARASGMANTFVGLSDDIYCIGYNPAGLGKIKDRQFASVYNKMYWGLSDNSDVGEWYAGYLTPVKGVPGWLEKFLSEKLNADVKDYGSVAFGLKRFSAAGLYSENTFIMSYGKNLEDVTGIGINAGMNFKIMSKEYSSTIYTENSIDMMGMSYGRDPVFGSGYSKWNVGIDLGGYYEINEQYSVGAAVTNINRPDTGLKDASLLPVGLKGGVCVKDGGANLLIDVNQIWGQTSLSSGYERWFSGGDYALRGGLELGSRDLANITAGLSIRHGKLVRFDYSFVMPLNGIKNTNGTHRIGVLVNFGDVKKEVLEYTPEFTDALKYYNKGEYIRASERLKAQKGEEAQGYLSRINVKMEVWSKEKRKGERYYYAEGLKRYTEGREREAYDLWKEYLKFNGKNEEVMEYSAQLSTKLETSRSKEIEALMSESRQMYQEGRYDEVMRRLERVLGLMPEHAEARMLMEESARRKDDEKKARVTERHMKALGYYAESKYAEAIGEWREVLKIDGNFNDAKEYIKKAEDAQKALQAAASAPNGPAVMPVHGPAPAPAVVVDETRAEENYNGALVKYAQGDLAGAVKELEAAVRLNPGHKSAQEALGRIKTEFEQKKAQQPAGPAPAPVPSVPQAPK